MDAYTGRAKPYGKWTDTRIDELKQHWADGLSCSQIAAEMGGITRNSVIGKVTRLNLPPRKRGPRPPYKPRQRTRSENVSAGGILRRIAKGPAITPEEPIEMYATDREIPIKQRKSLLELTENTCRWPVGDPGKEGFFFCGGAPAPERPYCHAHCAVAFAGYGNGVRRPFRDRAA